MRYNYAMMCLHKVQKKDPNFKGEAVPYLVLRQPHSGHLIQLGETVGKVLQPDHEVKWKRY